MKKAVVVLSLVIFAVCLIMAAVNAADREEKIIVCKECGEAFTLTADEQEFYAERGLPEPNVCKSCKSASAAARTGPEIIHRCKMCGAEFHSKVDLAPGAVHLCSECFKRIRVPSHSIPTAEEKHGKSVRTMLPFARRTPKFAIHTGAVMTVSPVVRPFSSEYGREKRSLR